MTELGIEYTSQSAAVNRKFMNYQLLTVKNENFLSFLPENVIEAGD